MLTVVTLISFVIYIRTNGDVIKENIGSKVSSKNRRIVNPPPTNYDSSCRKYFGISETPLSDCYSNHTRNFRHKEHVNTTGLSKYTWKLKDECEPSLITWNIMSVVNCRPRGGACRS